jgi:hypothetical protein
MATSRLVNFPIQNLLSEGALGFCIATEEAPVAVQALILLIRGDRSIPSRLLELGSIVGATQLEVGDDLCKEGTLRSITPP